MAKAKPYLDLEDFDDDNFNNDEEDELNFDHMAYHAGLNSDLEEPETDSLNYDVVDLDDVYINDELDDVDNVLDGAEPLIINSIKEIENKEDESDNSDDVAATPKRGRGRPKKIKTSADEEVKNEIDIWNYKLKDNVVNDIFKVSEFGKLNFEYINVKNPAGESSRYYTAHCNITGKVNTNNLPIWHTNNACLSQNYLVANIEEFVGNLKSKISIKNDKVKNVNPFALSWEGKVDKSYKLFENKYEAKIFEAVTGIDLSKFKPVTNELYINIINSYDGKSSLGLNFVTTMTLGNKDEKHVVYDYFTLTNKNIRSSHRGTFDLVESEIADLESNYNESVEMLKSYYPADFDKVTTEIAAKFMGDDKKKFKSLCSDIGGPNKNLYYVLFVASQMLNNKYTAKRHIGLDAVVSKYVKYAQKEYENNKINNSIKK